MNEDPGSITKHEAKRWWGSSGQET